VSSASRKAKALGVDRISAAFSGCFARKEPALVTYVMAGDPDIASSKAMALACVEGGADLLEIGIPFSDPIADGPTIQKAAERALASGTKLSDVLEVARAVRAKSAIPIALMGYLNPVHSRGLARFVDDCVDAGVDALIIPDLLPEEAGELLSLATPRGLKLVFLLAPTSGPDRILAAAEAATGFLYFVSVTGVTGARKALPKQIGAQVASVRAASRVPVVIGFGVSTPEQARAMGKLADGVVVGSAIVNRIAEGGSRKARADRVRRFVASLKRALRG
jgi:tryptophan synthase alpha chain